MLSGYKSPGVLAAEVKMTRMGNSDAIVVLEGQSDCRFWFTRFVRECALIDGEGKNNVLGCLNKLDDVGIGDVLGIVDDDLDSLFDVKLTSPNIVVTDYRDLECMLLCSDALENVLNEFGDWDRIRKFEQCSGCTVIKAVEERAIHFGKIRFAARMFNLSVNADGLRVRRSLNESTWTLDMDRLVKGTGGARHQILERCLAKLPVAEPWNIIRGHDAVDVLCVGLRRVLGRLGASTGREQICKVLRSGFSEASLRRSRVYSNICHWESVNGSCRVLRITGA